MLIFGLIFLICFIVICALTQGDRMRTFLLSLMFLLILMTIYIPFDTGIQRQVNYNYDIAYNLQQTPDGKWYDENDKYYVFITENKVIIAPKEQVYQYQSDKNILIESHNVRNSLKYWWVYSFDWTLSNPKDNIKEYKVSTN